MNTDITLSLLPELAEALVSANTNTGVMKALLGVFVRHGSLPWLEWIRDTSVERWDSKQSMTSETRMPSRSILSAFSSKSAQVVALARLRTEAANAVEVRRARSSGADRLCLLPGSFVFALPPGKSGLTAPVLDSAARVISSMLEKTEALRKAGHLSREAHEQSSVLRHALAASALPQDVIATSAAMRSILLDQVPLVAGHETTVLIRGETGTGKEVIARRIQALSRRAHRPFVRINCGAIPTGLTESTLFGHEAGAFTGAAGLHRGVFERADGGTLLLDEVGELPLSAQVKLLRVLQEQELERVGGERPVAVDVRVIAATHADLDALVRKRKFRADLLYRLDVFPIRLPPLRGRMDDIAPLVVSILNGVALKAGRAPPRLDSRVLARLKQHSWPGNVRELENVLERAMILSPHQALTLPNDFEERGQVVGPTQRIRPTSFAEGTAETIRRALEASDGRIYGAKGAAELLKLRPTTLQSKMRRLGMTATAPRLKYQ